MKVLSSAALALVTAGIVFAAGYPFVRDRHAIPAVYVVDEVATTEDIQEFDQMWAALEEMQKQGAPSQQEFRSRFLALTTAYLQLDDAACQRVEEVVVEGLEDFAQARINTLAHSTQPADTDPNSFGGGNSADRQKAWNELQERQRAISDRLLGLLDANPRHRLFAEKRLAWLMKLDFSLRRLPEGTEAPT